MNGSGNSLKHVTRLFEGVRAERNRQRTQKHGHDGNGARRPSVVYTQQHRLH